MHDSIVLYESESAYTHDELDYDYIVGVAADVARALRSGRPIEVAYQPGDWTRYGLVFTPLQTLLRARARVVDGKTWDSAAVSGMHGANGGYVENGYLVAWVEHTAYPFRLGFRFGRDLAGSYVSEHLTKNETSGVSVAILFRAIDWHLDHATEPVVPV